MKHMQNDKAIDSGLLSVAIAKSVVQNISGVLEIIIQTFSHTLVRCI
jgi:hypothetical protein